MKLKIAMRSNDDIFVFDETSGSPVMVARGGSMENLLSEIGRVTGNEIAVTTSFGDYVAGILFDAALEQMKRERSAPSSGRTTTG